MLTKSMRSISWGHPFTRLVVNATSTFKHLRTLFSNRLANRLAHCVISFLFWRKAWWHNLSTEQFMDVPSTFRTLFYSPHNFLEYWVVSWLCFITVSDIFTVEESVTLLLSFWCWYSHCVAHAVTEGKVDELLTTSFEGSFGNTELKWRYDLKKDLTD